MMRKTNLFLVAMAVLGLQCTVIGRASAQVGQGPLPPSGGVINGVLGSVGVLDGTNPGWLYYGLNAADRGLGYNGSYMTLGGFFPAVEDDVGGLWYADLRGHLSVYGGFFSNAGLVRKQFLGGSILGVGVYWDYDGDQNQYPTGGAPGTSQYGQFGHSYNQVGVSGEWLTDFGNLRSNGYIPVGTTAYTVGAPGFPFAANYLLNQYGLDAALGGADLEIGVYMPGLSDWAGMISVGGYALGNARYQWWQGTQAGDAVVPWFGGVYTRLDMTFLQNWDFSLQANNDSYFDWTGFARLTYRMGGSRRRNVPDQMEQPMMRNEHIVRSHQTPVVAINPMTNTPWHVVHVNNTAALGGTGTAESPVQALEYARQRAVTPYDIIFVHAGNSATTPYIAGTTAAGWEFQAANQILVGQGSGLQLNTVGGGYRSFFTLGSPQVYPIINANTITGTGITLRNGAIVDHLQITNASTGIATPATMAGTAYGNDLLIGRGGDGVTTGVVLDGPGTTLLYNLNVTQVSANTVAGAGTGSNIVQGFLQGVAAAPVGTQINQTADTLDVPGVARNSALTQPYQNGP